jgi:hypothetical protein
MVWSRVLVLILRNLFLRLLLVYHISRLVGLGVGVGMWYVFLLPIFFHSLSPLPPLFLYLFYRYLDGIAQAARLTSSSFPSVDCSLPLETFPLLGIISSLLELHSSTVSFPTCSTRPGTLGTIVVMVLVSTLLLQGRESELTCRVVHPEYPGLH